MSGRKKTPCSLKKKLDKGVDRAVKRKLIRLVNIEEEKVDSFYISIRPRMYF